MLKQIIETKKEEIKALKKSGALFPQHVKEREQYFLSLSEAIEQQKQHGALIAEIKKASPSKGIIRKDFNPLDIALTYEAHGAHALSILTDRQYFQGNPDYINLVKRHVRLPVLRKDFILESIQIRESIQIGADAILLIAKALPSTQLQELYIEAIERGLDVLVEVGTQRELEAVLELFSPRLLGINNRNLETFQTDIQNTLKLLPYLPAGITVISESGLSESAQLKKLLAHGVSGFLIGEYFMRQEHIGQAIEALYA